MALSIDAIEATLKTIGYTVERINSKRTKILTDDDRIAILKNIAEIFKKQKSNSVYNPIINGSSVGGTIVDGITILAKGKSKQSSVHYEIAEINSINKQFEDIMKKEGFDYIPIEVKGKVYKCKVCQKTEGTPKSDFHLIDINGKECIWISHKAGRTPKDFQQWGGLTDKIVKDHQEVKQFAEDMRKLFPGGIMPNATTCMKRIKDEILRNKAVYGYEYTSSAPMSRNNVTFVLQGSIVVSKLSNGNYTLKAVNTHINGDKINGDSLPVFMCMYKGDRNNLGLIGARAGISPIVSRKVNIDLDKPDTIKKYFGS